MKNKTIQHIDNVNPLNCIMGFFYGSPKWLYPDSSKTSSDRVSQYLHREDIRSITRHSDRNSMMHKNGFSFPCVDGQGGPIPLKIEITIE